MTLLATVTLVSTLALTSCKKPEDVNPTTDTPTTTDTTTTTNTGNTGTNTGNNSGTNTGTPYVPNITVATNGALVEPANINVVATIDNLIADSIAKVELLDGSTVIATLTTSPFSFARNGLTAGTYNYTVKLTGTNGNVTSKAVTFTIVKNNTAPTFTSSTLGTLASTTTTYTTDISSIVNDVNGDNITITSITTNTSGVTVTKTGDRTISLTSSTKGVSATLVITITDGTTSTTNSNVTVKLGMTPQEETTNLMSGFLNRTLSPSNPSGLRFNSTGTVSTGVNNTQFWGASCTTGTWSVQTDGTLKISNGCNNGTNYYTVTTANNNTELYLTNTAVSTYFWYGK